jgi:hypothetical protein
MNALYLEFIIKPLRDDLADRLIRNKARAGGDCGRMLDELLKEEEGIGFIPYEVGA